MHSQAQFGVEQMLEWLSSRTIGSSLFPRGVEILALGVTLGHDLGATGWHSGAVGQTREKPKAVLNFRGNSAKTTVRESVNVIIVRLIAA